MVKTTKWKRIGQCLWETPSRALCLVHPPRLGARRLALGLDGCACGASLHNQPVPDRHDTQQLTLYPQPSSHLFIDYMSRTGAYTPHMPRSMSRPVERPPRLRASHLYPLCPYLPTRPRSSLSPAQRTTRPRMPVCPLVPTPALSPSALLHSRNTTSCRTRVIMQGRARAPTPLTFAAPLAAPLTAAPLT